MRAFIAIQPQLVRARFHALLTGPTTDKTELETTDNEVEGGLEAKIHCSGDSYAAFRW